MIWTRHLFVSVLAILMALVVLVVMAVGALQFLMNSGPIVLPKFQSLFLDRINDQLNSQSLSIGSISLGSTQGGTANQIVMRAVTLRDENDKTVLNVPEIRTDFSLMNLFRGVVAPTEIEIVGSKLQLVRQMDGRISLLRLSDDGKSMVAEDNMAALDALLQRPELQSLRAINLRKAEISVLDMRSGRKWQVSDSQLELSRDGDLVTLQTEVFIDSGHGEQSKVRASVSHELASKSADVIFQFSNGLPTDVADLVGALGWMRILETRISGSLVATVYNDGVVGELNGVLDLAKGRLRQTPSSVPIGFERAKLYFNYDKASDQLAFSQLKIDTTAGAVTSEGYLGLKRDETGAVISMAGQFRFSDIKLDRPKLLAAPVEFDAASLDFRMAFDPLTITVGSLTVFDGAATYQAAGESVAGTDYWTNKYDIEISSANQDRVMDLWPVTAIPKTRLWLDENISKGTVRNFRGGLRSKGGKFKYAFNFEVEDAQVRYMKTLPELRQGQGFGYLTNNDLRINLLQGHVIAADNTRVDVAGSVFYIPDLNQRPAIGDVTIDARLGVQAALHLLDAEKFEFLKKVGLTPQVASGRVTVKGQLQVPLDKNAKPTDVRFDAAAEVFDLASDTLVKGRKLRSEKMLLRATDKGLEMQGPVTLDSVPMQARWTLGFGKAAAKGSEIVADLDLSQSSLNNLGITLPKGSIKGTTPARVVVNILKGKTPTYQVSSKLRGARLQVPALQWVKSSKSAGQLSIRGSFGTKPTVDEISLAAPGMKAKGKIDFYDNGTMKALRLRDLRAGNWLDSTATIALNNQGIARVLLDGGAADMRNFNLSGGTGGGGSASTGPVDIRLDRLTIVTGIALTNFVAKLEPGNQVTGSFVGRVNGGQRITGTLYPHKYGTAFEFKGDDAGRILASAGLMENVYEGDMQVVIVPRATAGEYDGTLKVKNTRMTSTSAMAGLLNGISVVGALQQLEGEGIHFSTVEGKFLMRPNGVQIKDISAVGPSIGITLDGWYDSKNRTVDFEGVTTPLYALNGLFERALGKLGGRKKGEGLFSFTYTMKGNADDPKVQVNPLSILTPGAFREIFRSKAPKEPGGEMSKKPTEQTRVVAKEQKTKAKVQRKKNSFGGVNDDLR